MTNLDITLKQLKDRNNAQSGWDLFRALILDLNPDADLGPTPEESYFDPVKPNVREAILKPLEHLSWFPVADVVLFSNFRSSTRRFAPHPTFQNEYDVVWLDIRIQDMSTIQLPKAGLTALRDVWVNERVIEVEKMLGSHIRSSLILFVTIHGPGYKLPEIALVGPSATDEKKGEPPFVKVVYLGLNRDVQAQMDTNSISAKLAQHLGHLRANNDNWRVAFKHSLSNSTEIRNVFRRRMQSVLAELMNLIEESSEKRAQESELGLLREAATLLAFRLMFLTEVARRGLLYTEARTGARTLLELVDAESNASGDLLRKLTHLAKVLRGDLEDDHIAISGASIFANQPNPAFDPRLADWLEPVEALPMDANPDLLRRWDAALSLTAAVVTGGLDDHVHLSSAGASGFGGSEHAQRILGDVYEQILALTPRRAKNGFLTLQVEVDGKKTKEKDERKALGAHYTPEVLVDEVVRAAWRPLFEYYWKEAGGNAEAYIELIRPLRVLDPAMGSAHFLTTAALELAREVAFAELKGEPRPFEIHEQTAYPNSHEATLNALGAQHEPAFMERIRELIPGIVQECCYGVDINPLAAELGKLSLWLFALAVDKRAQIGFSKRPELTFLDGNIIVGDSLVGTSWAAAKQTLWERFGLDIEGEELALFKNALQKDSEYVQACHEIMRLPSAELTHAASRVSDINALLKHLDPRYISAFRRRILELAKTAQKRIRWVYDLALLAEFYEVKKTKTGAKKLVEAIRGTGYEINDEANDALSKSNFWQMLKPHLGINESDTSLHNVLHQLATHLPGKGKTHRALHWELDFPGVFALDLPASERGFDLIVANPPFMGDKRLRANLDQALVKYLANHYTRGNVPEYTGFFLLKYRELASRVSSVGTIGPNSVAQASNRDYITFPLTANSDFVIWRALSSRPWPGDANVHYCLIHFVDPNLEHRDRILVASLDDLKSTLWRATPVDSISSYLDNHIDLPMNFLPSMPKTKLALTGMFIRGNFSIHREPQETLIEAIARVPTNERRALAAYLNNRDVQQESIPTPSDVLIDFYRPLADAGLENASPEEQIAFLEDEFKCLFPQLKSRSPHAPAEPCVYEQRLALSDSSDDAGDKLRWYLFARPRPALRQSWAGRKYVLTFGRVTKIWSPPSLFTIDPSLMLPICPMDKIFVSSESSPVWNGLTLSFLFEQIVRRQCGTLKSDLNFSPTDVFPFLPVPWQPHFKLGTCELTVFPVDEEDPKLKTIATAAEDLIETRTDLLANPKSHGLKVAKNWGPTELYNLYDDEEVTNSGVEHLRQAHVNLQQSVLRAYGWDDLAELSTREHWIFDRPWIDRTPRFVPSEDVRREVYVRMGELNTTRYKEELTMLLDRALTVTTKYMSVKDIAKAMNTKYCTADVEGKNEVDLAVLEEALKLGVESGRVTERIGKAKKKGNELRTYRKG